MQLGVAVILQLGNSAGDLVWEKKPPPLDKWGRRLMEVGDL